jgi:hypothetical protein
MRRVSRLLAALLEMQEAKTAVSDLEFFQTDKQADVYLLRGTLIEKHDLTRVQES